MKCPGNGQGQCYRMAVELKGWQPDSEVECNVEDGPGSSRREEFRVDGSGNWSGELDRWVFHGPGGPINITNSCKQDD